MPRLEAVLFDLDGTLLDSAPDIRQALNQMLAEDGRRTISLEQVKNMIGNGAMELCRRALLATGGVMADDLFPYVQKFIRHYRELPPDPSQIFPGATDVLDSLVKAGVKLGVCTNKPEGATQKILEQLGLIHYFGFIAGGDTYPVHKPNPGHVTGVVSALGANLEGCVFVGDGPNDVIASRKAGIPCLVVTHGYGEDYASMEADELIPDMTALLPKLTALGYVW